MKELFEDIKLSKIAYLLEKIEKEDIDGKVKYFRKLEQYKITKKIGLFLIKNSTRDYGVNDELGGINSSIIELCFKDYQKEYNKAIEEIFDDLTIEAKDRVLFLLTTVADKKSLELYSDLILKYYKKRETIPIGQLIDKPETYPYLFPKLYKALTFESKRNNLIILLNNYLNAGVVPKEDLSKNKKVITDAICKLFEEALTYKFKSTFDGLHNKKYKKLRYFLELAINIELSVSGRKTKGYLVKLLSKNDNQLKLFIIDNYIRKGQKIDRINYTSIAKDKASRYALFELLNVYDKVNLMPKKYLDQKSLAESDFYTNFVILSAYTNEPEKIKFYNTINVDGLDYYTFKFKYEYKYNSRSNDYLTNYICSQVGIEKYNDEKLVEQFIGISGGYLSQDKPSTVVNPQKKLLFSKIDFEDQIDNLILSLIYHQNFELIKAKEEEKRKQKEEENKKLLEKEKKKLEKEKIEKEEKKKFTLFKKKEEKVTPIEKEEIKEEPKEEIQKTEETEIPKKEKFVLFKKKEKIPKEKKSFTLFKKKEKTITPEVELPSEEIIDKPKKRYHIFSYFLLFLFAIFLGLLVYCIMYIYGVGSLNDGFNGRVIKADVIKDKGNFTEILGREIFNQTESDYFVLLYTGAKSEKNKYYGFINEYAKRNVRFYYVDLTNEENKFLYGPNELGFTLASDRFLKVKDHEFEYYVDGKTHILNEMEVQIEALIRQEEEAKKAEEAKAKEEAKQANQYKVTRLKNIAANIAEIAEKGPNFQNFNIAEMVAVSE